jgi:hypothetical protein
MPSRHASPTSGLIPFFSASPGTKLRRKNRGGPDPCSNITDLCTGHREPPQNSESFPLSCIEVCINPKGTVLGVNLCGNPPIEDSMNPCQRIRAVSYCARRVSHIIVKVGFYPLSKSPQSDPEGSPESTVLKPKHSCPEPISRPISPIVCNFFFDFRFIQYRLLQANPRHHIRKSSPSDRSHRRFQSLRRDRQNDSPGFSLLGQDQFPIGIQHFPHPPRLL